jgi:D-alanyl-D-alanine carboxypeptidase/poly-gamma-glutamate capsule biosynthesis protein CapA/YwtB (metallophosphatase superfamily)/lipoprotein-anchoring transpeptidase ErfK/SrfK
MQNKLEKIKTHWNDFRAFIEEHRRGMLLWSFVMICLFVIIPFIQSYVSFNKKYNSQKKAEVATIQPELTSLEQVQEIIEPDRIVFEKIPEESYLPPPKGKIIRINLYSMTLKRFENGTLIDTKKVLAKGTKGSLWEVPSGSYPISNAIEDYYSENVGAYMPYALNMFGNYFIHGEPHDKSGRTLSRSFRNGGIRLSTQDAKEIYEWSDPDTRISVYSDSTLVPQPISTESVYVSSDGTIKPKVSAEAYIVADIDTGEIIIQKDKDHPYPIASTSKLMTAVVSVENQNQFDYATVTKKAIDTDGFSGYIPGEKIELSNLLNPLLLPSSNDASEIIAEHFGRADFMQKMNDKAKDLGMDNTNYDDPSGLSSKNVASAHDLFRLAQYITKEKPFLWDITKRRLYSAQGHTAKNINQFLRDPNHIGSKSGFTYAAKQSNVAVFDLQLSEITRRKVGIIILRSNDRYRDTQNILSYLKKQVIYARDGKFVISGPKDKSKELTMRFAGDIMLDRGVKYSVNKNFGGDFRQLFANLSSYKDADIFFANLEGPVSDAGKDMHNLYSFRMSPTVLPMLADVGLDIVSFANNHVGDWGRDAFLDTMSQLDKTEIAYTGSGTTLEQAQNPKILERKGLKVGFIGFSDVGPSWLYNTDTDGGYGINKLDTDTFDSIVKNASQKVDILVISIHWGEEYQKPTERQKEFARRAIDNGAKIVAGHHPHVIQPLEVYKGGLIAYSLGNFIFDQGFSRDTMRGLTLEVTLDTDDKYITRYDTYITEQDPYFVPGVPFKEKVLEEE